MPENFMNEPFDNCGIAYEQYDYKTGKNYIHCPYCGKKQFPVSEVKKSHYRCKSKNCGKEYEVII